MQISPINNTEYNTNFNSKVVQTKELGNYFEYQKKYTLPRNGSLMKKIISAIEANPSDAIINLDISYIQGQAINARGIISSQYGKFTDTEPARSDSIVPIENIVKRILNPENRAQMNKLFGVEKGSENTKKQNKWWEKYISPIWKDIQEVFHGDMVDSKEKQALYNQQFRETNKV